MELAPSESGCQKPNFTKNNKDIRHICPTLGGEEKRKMNQITAKELELLLEEKKDVNIIDVREAAEVAGGKIPGAVNIPLGLIEFKINELDKSKEYYIVCYSGGRSGQATRFLESQGFQVTNMMGGMMNWAGEIE